MKVRRTGLVAEQVREPDKISFEWEQGLIFCRWRLKESRPFYRHGSAVLASGLCFSVETARLRAAEWLAVNRLKESPEPPVETATESVAEMLRANDKLR